MRNIRKNQDMLILNIAPITFSEANILVGRLGDLDRQTYREVREKHQRTHVFRFDHREGEVLNVAIAPDVEPLGRVDEVPLHEFLMGRALQKLILLWLIENNLRVLKSGKRLVFLGRKAESRLLTQVVRDLGLNPLHGVEALVRYDIDVRTFRKPYSEFELYLGLVIDVSTANVIDLSVAELIERGMDIIGRYVCKAEEKEEKYTHPRPDLVGKVSQVKGTRLLLTDTESLNEIDARVARLEPRKENFAEVIHVLYGRHADEILARLEQRRARLTTATGKLRWIRQTLDSLKKRRFVIGDNIEVRIGDLLTSANSLFPERIATSRPTFLFGPQGRKYGSYPDDGIRKWGPFQYMQHTRNTPLVAVVCEASHRGRVEQFVKLLRDGFPDELWKREAQNPFHGGLLGKFRLSRVTLEYEEVSRPTGEEYRRAIRRLLERLPKNPDLAIVQIREGFKERWGDANPYLVAKAAFMEAGVPVQAVCIENMEADEAALPYILNNIAVASYAKLDGIPWVISTREPTSHELVIGMGYTEVGSRLGAKTRYVGITTVFQGDGRYIVWGLTREVEFQNYPEALLENLRATIRYVQKENAWQEGDDVRLVFHVYKPLKYREIEAVKRTVEGLVEEDHLRVKYAFLDISRYHPYQIFAPNQKGVGKERKGEGVPRRGLCCQLSSREALLQLTGPRGIKTPEQGIPRPLLVRLHPDSDFDDLPYLVRQIYHFTYMSWRSFFPATEPVTILYSRLIARMLASLRPVSGWNSTVLSVGSLRNRRWFL